MNAFTKSDAGLLSLLVKQIRFEAAGINSYELVDPEGAPLPVWTAGSHLDIHLPDGLIRQYSLCGNPADRRRYVIAVLKEATGRGGSRQLHETLQVQHIVKVSPPRNHFALAPAAARSILIGGGIGITPLKAMAHELSAAGASYSLHYCAKSPAHAAFLDELDRLGGTMFHYDHGNPADGLDIAGLLRDYAEGTHVYYCGPGGFMAACATATAHWPKGTVHSEHFKTPVAPPADAPSLPEGSFLVELASTGKMIEVGADTSIVDALSAAGIEIETSCVSGLCGTCKVKYLSGTVDHRDYILADDERGEYLTACVSRALGGKLVLDL